MKRNIFILALMSITIIACTKNESTGEEILELGKVQFVNKSLVPGDSVSVALNEGEVVSSKMKVGEEATKLVLAHNHSFKVYSIANPSLLLQGNFDIGHNQLRKITLFRISDMDPLSIVNINTDTVTVPADEYVKISVANFTDHLPENIDVIFIQQVNNRPVTMDTVARFENVKRDFTPFQEIRLRRNQSNVLQYNFGIALYNRDTQEYLRETIRLVARFSATTKIYTLYINTERPSATVTRTALNSF